MKKEGRMGYITVKEASDRWNMSIRSIQGHCKRGKIPGVKRAKDGWMIPSDAKPPTDGRIVTGKYIDWRKKYPRKVKDSVK